jgi:hypothetical protein
MISSCTLPEEDTSSLVGRVYIDEKTSDRIVFVEKGLLIISWAVCEKPWIKEFPYRFKYIIYKNDKEIHLIEMTSGEGFFFPYRTLSFSDSRGEILFTDRNDESGMFKKRDK